MLMDAFLMEKWMLHDARFSWGEAGVRLSSWSTSMSCPCRLHIAELQGLVGATLLVARKNVPQLRALAEFSALGFCRRGYKAHNHTDFVHVTNQIELLGDGFALLSSFGLGSLPEQELVACQ